MIIKVAYTPPGVAEEKATRFWASPIEVAMVVDNWVVYVEVNRDISDVK